MDLISTFAKYLLFFYHGVGSRSLWSRAEGLRHFEGPNLSQNGNINNFVGSDPHYEPGSILKFLLLFIMEKNYLPRAKRNVSCGVGPNNESFHTTTNLDSLYN